MDNYEIVKILGSGSQGTVFEARRRSDGKEIALKEMTSLNPEVIELAKKEIDFLRILSAPECNTFIVCYYGSFSIGDKFYIEMELIKGMNMLNFLSQFKNKEESNYFTLLIAKDLATALNYVHGKGIIHNDIKFENILIDRAYTPKLIDFGLACQTNRVNVQGPYCISEGGTPDYVPPEFFTGYQRSSATDMWALGIVLFGAGNGHFPFPETKTVEELFNYIRTKPVLKSKSGSDLLDHIVNRLLVRNPVARLTANEMLQLLNVIDRPANVTKPVVKNVPSKPGTGLNESRRVLVKAGKGTEHSFTYL